MRRQGEERKQETTRVVKERKPEKWGETREIRRKLGEWECKRVRRKREEEEEEQRKWVSGIEATREEKPEIKHKTASKR